MCGRHSTSSEYSNNVWVSCSGYRGCNGPQNVVWHADNVRAHCDGFGGCVEATECCLIFRRHLGEVQWVRRVHNGPQMLSGMQTMFRHIVMGLAGMWKPPNIIWISDNVQVRCSGYGRCVMAPERCLACRRCLGKVWWVRQVDGGAACSYMRGRWGSSRGMLSEWEDNVWGSGRRWEGSGGNKHWTKPHLGSPIWAIGGGGGYSRVQQFLTLVICLAWWVIEWNVKCCFKQCLKFKEKTATCLLSPLSSCKRWGKNWGCIQLLSDSPCGSTASWVSSHLLDLQIAQEAHIPWRGEEHNLSVVVKN